jgi:membrane protein YqaA with SNARE-associated domain
VQKEQAISVKKPNIVKRIYDWVISWADSPYGIYALGVLAFAESSFFPIPPDVLLIALSLGAHQKAMRFALVCTVMSVLGGIGGYIIGSVGYEVIGKSIIDAYDGYAIMERIHSLYDEYGFWGILGAAITPIPYKVFTIASGFFSFNFVNFLAASIVGRSIRFFAVAGLIALYGPKIKDFIEKYFNLLAVVFTILLAGGFFLIKYISE